MPPLDIKNIAAVDVDNLEEEDVDRLFKEISDYVIEDGENIENVQQLFVVTQSVMLAKGLQADVALEELDSMAADAVYYIISRRESFQFFQGENAGPSTGTSSSLLREEIRELKQQNEDLLKEIKSKDRDLLHEKNECERYMARCDDLEKHKRDQHREINQLKEDIENMGEQLKMQAVSDDSDINREQDRIKKISEKNKQIHVLINDIDKLEEEKTFLANENTEMKEKLKDATEQMEKTTNEYLNMKVIILCNY
ncbi:Centrosomal protein [Nymphon striatum]|nr:Centrosomal protein [Nymphon striatum]